MVEHQLEGLCYNCDEKYFSWHKCKEHKLFMDISKDASDKEVETPPVVELPEPIDLTLSFDPPKVELILSLNAFTVFFVPKTLKLIGYIKNWKIIILIDSGNTHNFIHRRVAQETHCYIHAINNFQIMIANGGSMC